MAWLRIALALAYLLVSGIPCTPQAGDRAVLQERLHAYSAGAVHAHGGAPAREDGELRAPCPCGCDESPAAALASGLHGSALLPAVEAPRLPRAVHERAPMPLASGAPARLPEPVPRSA
jgi:hypothetical protein